MSDTLNDAKISPTPKWIAKPFTDGSGRSRRGPTEFKGRASLSFSAAVLWRVWSVYSV